MHMKEPANRRDAPDRQHRLRRFLNAYWLRPENAFWMTLRSEALADVPWKSPAVDLCCGDGIFSFIHAGGLLDESFDVFQGADRPEQQNGRHIDMFDQNSSAYQPKIIEQPGYSIDVGTDLKPNLLTKARMLAHYDRLIEHDANHPLPLGDRCFATIHCNAAYWIENIDGFLSELRRIARPDARIVLHVKFDAMRQFNLGDFRRQLGDKFLDIIARGRLECWPTLGDREAWEARFAQARLKVLQFKPFATESHARVWDVGLRPLAPLLVRMANELNPATRLLIKRDWVKLVLDLATPFCDPDLHFGLGKSEVAEGQYVLTI